MKSDVDVRRAPWNVPRVRRGSLLLVSLAFVQASWAHEAYEPLGPYQGWIWETGVEASAAGVVEEYCSGEFGLEFEHDFTWTAAAPDEVCWGRETDSDSRVIFNAPPHAGNPFEARSTQPLVNAGGNLYEVYGEDVVAGVGQGEERAGTLLVEPSGADLLVVAAHESADTPDGRGLSQAINVAIKATPEVIAARTTADLAGTAWRISIAAHVPSPNVVASELATNTIWTLALQSGGVCAFSTSSVFPDFLKNGDGYSARQGSDGTDLDNRDVRGGVAGAALSDCTYSVDPEGYLAIAATRTPDLANGSPGNPQSLALRYLVSDNAEYLILAPDTDGTPHDPHDLSVGYRVADSLPAAALDGEYLFYLFQVEYQATGTASSTGQTGVQETDTRGRGLFRFDSSMPGETPAGESGSWFSCAAQLGLDAMELGYTGDYGLGTAAATTILGSNSGRLTACAYQLGGDGALSVHVRDVVVGSDPYEATFRGYVNANGEVAALVASTWNPAANRLFRLRDNVSVANVLAVKYIGTPNGNQDGDALTNFQEFQYPQRPAERPFACAEGALPIVCSIPDVNANGTADVAVVRQGSIVAEIRDGADGALLGNLSFLSAAYTPSGAAVLPDTDGDAVPELALLAVRNSDGRMIVQVRNLDGSGVARSLWFSTGYSAIAMAVIDDDADNDGVPELAVLSTRNSDGRGVVELKNAFGNANAKTIWAPVGYSFVDMEVLPDADGNGVPDIAVLSTRTSDGRNLVQVRNADGLGAPYSTWFGQGQTALDLAVVPDKDADGIPEVAVLSSRKSDGRLLVELKNAAGAAQNLRQLWLPPGYTGVALEAVNPSEGNSVPEIAVATQRISDGRILVSVRSVVGAENLRSIWYSDGFAAGNLAILADLDANGVEEAAVLMIRNSDGRILVQSRNTSGAQAPRSYWFSP